MPKKTRQEKIVAQLKRLQQQTSNLQPTGPAEKSQPTVTLGTNLKSLETAQTTSFAPEKRVELNYQYVYNDLRKTLIFVSLAVIFEIVLSRFV